MIHKVSEEKLMEKYGIPAQRYCSVIATAFGISLKYDKWEKSRESRREFRNESIIFYSDALPTNPAWKITEGRKRYVRKYRERIENWRFGWQVWSRARNEYTSWNEFSRNRSLYISAKRFSNILLWCFACFYRTRRLFQDRNYMVRIRRIEKAWLKAESHEMRETKSCD